MKKTVMLIVLAISMTGCSTFYTRCLCGGYRETPIYPATTGNWTAIVSIVYETVSHPMSCSCWATFIGLPLMLIDTPISIAVDTLCLPHDIYTWPDWAEAREKQLRIQGELDKALKDVEQSEDYNVTDAVPSPQMHNAGQK